LTLLNSRILGSEKLIIIRASLKLKTTMKIPERKENEGLVEQEK
jgi:hypothetical protein